MDRALAIPLGIVAIGLLVYLPEELRREPRPVHARVGRALELEALNEGLLAEALRLRMARDRNYDRLFAIHASAEEKLEALAEELAASPAPEDRALQQSLRSQESLLDRKRRLVEDFPTHNASVLNSLASLPYTYEAALAEGDEELGRQGWSAAELTDLYLRTMARSASWNSVEAERALRAHRLRAREASSESSALRAFLRHVEIALEQRLVVERLMGELEKVCEESRLGSAIEGFLQAASEEEARRGRAVLGVRLACYAVAGLVAAGLWLGGVRQNRRLREEIEERERLHERARAYEGQLRHAQTLESVGRLAAGLAHEINSPAQYVGDNTRFLGSAFAELLPLLARAGAIAREAGGGGSPEATCRELAAAFERADLDDLEAEIPRAVAGSLEGLERVSEIVRTMKEFSLPGDDGITGVDLNRSIENTIRVCRTEWASVAELETDLDPELPLVRCSPSGINQVVLHLVVNAAHAIADREGSDGATKGRITITTRRDGASVEIRVADTGTGIPESVRERVFDPFFTTKDVGRGRGHGLAVAHGVVVVQHGGSLELESEVGRGSTFVVRLPVDAAAGVELAP